MSVLIYYDFKCFILTRIIKFSVCNTNYNYNLTSFFKLSCKQFFPIMLKKNAQNQTDNIEIFRSCLLPKMRLSVVLEGRYIGYRSITSQTSKKCCICFSNFESNRVLSIFFSFFDKIGPKKE